MSTDAAPGLTVLADLAVSVTAVDGRTGSVTVRDQDGTVVVSLAGLRALFTSLPRGAAPPTSLLARLVAPARVVARSWRQPVDVLVGSRVVLRRRRGTWRPAPVLAVPVLGAVAAVAGFGVALGAVGAALVRQVRRTGTPSAGASG